MVYHSAPEINAVDKEMSQLETSCGAHYEIKWSPYQPIKRVEPKSPPTHQLETRVHHIAPESDAIDNELSLGDHHMTQIKQDAVSQDTSISCYLTGQAFKSLYL